MSKSLIIIMSIATVVGPAQAGSILLFSSGSPDGKMATLSTPTGPGQLETETADDFVLGQNASITGATFTGLLVGGASTASITDVEIELYHIFPVDSTLPPDGRVVTRVNSPSDNHFAAFDLVSGSISLTTSVLSGSFTAANSVVNGIHAAPNQFTGGEGPVTGTEVQFFITFNTPFLVGATDHDFFRPEVAVTGGQFLWLSSPFTAGGTDLQTWIRNEGAGALAPDWERIGTDVTHQGPFNASFSLSGVVVPEPSTALSLAIGLLGLGIWGQRRLNIQRARRN